MKSLANADITTKLKALSHPNISKTYFYNPCGHTIMLIAHNVETAEQDLRETFEIIQNRFISYWDENKTFYGDLNVRAFAPVLDKEKNRILKEVYTPFHHDVRKLMVIRAKLMVLDYKIKKLPKSLQYALGLIKTPWVYGFHGKANVQEKILLGLKQCNLALEYQDLTVVQNFLNSVWLKDFWLLDYNKKIKNMFDNALVNLQYYGP